MTGNAPAALLDALIDSLDRERECLITGDYEALSEAATASAGIVAQIEAMPQAALKDHDDSLARLRDASARNERLLRAALDGAAAGRRRVAEVLQARERLSSYNAAGEAVEHGTAARVGRKA